MCMQSPRGALCASDAPARDACVPEKSVAHRTGGMRATRDLRR
jgi:hypothetical protein